MKNKVQNTTSLKKWWQESINREMSEADDFTAQLTDEDIVQDLLKLKWRMKKAEAKKLFAPQRQNQLAKDIMKAIYAEPKTCKLLEFKLPDHKLK